MIGGASAYAYSRVHTPLAGFGEGLAMFTSMSLACSLIRSMDLYTFSNDYCINRWQSVENPPLYCACGIL